MALVVSVPVSASAVVANSTTPSSVAEAALTLVKSTSASGTVTVLSPVGSVILNVVSCASGLSPSNIRLPCKRVSPSDLKLATTLTPLRVVPLLALVSPACITTAPPAALPVALPPNICKSPAALSVPVASPPLIYKSPPASSVCLNLLIVAAPLSSAPISSISLL